MSEYFRMMKRVENAKITHSHGFTLCRMCVHRKHGKHIRMLDMTFSTKERVVECRQNKNGHSRLMIVAWLFSAHSNHLLLMLATTMNIWKRSIIHFDILISDTKISPSMLASYFQMTRNNHICTR